MDRQSEIDQENLQKKEEISISKPELKRKKSRWGDSLPNSNEKLLSNNMPTLPPQAEEDNGSQDNLNCEKKRKIDEVSSSENWTNQYDKNIPDEILLLCSTERCDLCGVKFTSVVASEDHYRGAKHEKKVKLKLVDLFPEESSRPKKLKVDSGGDATSFPSDFSCKVCGIRSLGNKKSYEDHINGKIHKKRQREQEQANGTFYCDLCNVFSQTKQDFDNHLRGKPHTKRKEQIEQLELEGGILSCELCMMTCNNEEQLEMHFQGKRHQSKLLGVQTSQVQFQCAVCNISTTSQSSLIEHLKGKSHMTMLQKGGYTQGYPQGYQQDYLQRYHHGYPQGYHQGYPQGYHRGYPQGYNGYY